MEEDDKNTSFLRDKPAFIKGFLFVLCLILLIWLTYVVGALILTRDNYKNETAELDEYFKDCSILEKNCTNASCSFYNSCDGAQKVCRIYDCSGEYGIFIKDNDGQIRMQRRAKPDTAAIEAEKEACRGSMEVLEQDCINNEYRAKVRVTTKSQCEIGNFIVIFENSGSQPNKFVSLGDGVYAVSVDHCGKATEISPVSASGIYLEF